MSLAHIDWAVFNTSCLVRCLQCIFCDSMVLLFRDPECWIPQCAWVLAHTVRHFFFAFEKLANHGLTGFAADKIRGRGNQGMRRWRARCFTSITPYRGLLTSIEVFRLYRGLCSWSRGVFASTDGVFTSLDVLLPLYLYLFDGGLSSIWSVFTSIVACPTLII